MFRGTLYPFQERAVRRMLKMQRLLVAFEMGLGKTVLAIAVIEELVERGEVAIGWVVCPASLKYQWRDQIEKFTDGALVCVVEGTPEQRKRQYLDVRRGQYEYVIFNYEQLVNDWTWIRTLPRDFIIADEVAAIKSFHAKRSKRLKKLDAPYKFGLTGQPIENRPEDLFCVDEDTEILSEKRGWLRRDQLQRGDRVLTLNHATGLSEWQAVQAVNTYFVENQNMISIEHKRHSSLTTPDHRWPVERAHELGGRTTQRTRTWATSESFEWRDRIIAAAPRAIFPTTFLYSDEMVEEMARAYAEGKGCSPEREFLMSLTKAQLDLFIEVALRSTAGGPYTFSPHEHDDTDPFQLACILAGYATTTRLGPKLVYDKKGEAVVRPQVRVHRNPYLRPSQASRLAKPVEGYTGVVWCPTTANGTWLARRNGTVYFTGNSIMQWVNPEVLGRFDYFDHIFLERDTFGRVRRVKNLNLLRRKMRLHMTRCTQAEVADQLPRVLEEHIPVVADLPTRRLYNHIRADLLESLTTLPRNSSFNLEHHYSGETEGHEAQGQVMSQMLALRMLCDHPILIQRSAEKYDDAQLAQGSEYASDLVAAGFLKRKLRPIKFEATKEVIDQILAENPQNKIVVFSFFKEMGRLFQEVYGKQSVLFNGDMTAKEKAAAKTQFATNPNVRLFLSSDAGGVGLDLPEANYLINYDLPWSAGAFKQRMSRIIRLSSEWAHVTLISFLVEGSIEERQYAMLMLKAGVAAAIIDGQGFDVKDGVLDLNLETLTTFLMESKI